MKLLPTIVLACVAALPLRAQKPAPADSSWEARSRTVFNVMYTDPSPLPTLTIETDMRTLISGKYDEAYQPAVVGFRGAGGETLSWDARLRARGNRRKEVCPFPPTKLNFDETTLLQQGFLPFDKIKLVNQCRSGKSFENYLLKEYLAYRLYNQLTPASMRVRLVRMTYIDTGGKESTQEFYGLILEPEEELAARLQAVPVELGTTHFVNLESEFANQLSLFQYMIGNTDWNVANRHNLLTYKLPQYRKLVPVPYDFDYSGIVGTPYAVPHESLPITDVRDRYHKGAMMSTEELDVLIDRFRKLRPDFEAACELIAPFDERSAKEAGKFIQYFLDMLKNKRVLEDVFVRNRQ